MDLEDKKYIDAGILGCNEENLNEATDNLEEAFETWKAEAWLRGERRENVARMTSDTILDYASYLYHKGEEALVIHNRPRAMQCANLLRQLQLACRVRNFNITEERISDYVEQLRYDISGGALNNQDREEERPDSPRRGLFNPTRETESLKEDNEDNLNEEVEIHTTLNPLIWNEDETLKPEVEEKIKNVVKMFVDILTENKIKIKVMDIYLVGSNANYNYNESSDIDIHIIADESFDCDDKHLPLLYNAYKTLFNKKYDISFNGINVEVYVENANDINNVSTAEYSLNKGWIKKPNLNDIPQIDQEAVGEKVAELTKEYEEIKASPTIDAIDNYINELYALRQSSIKEEGEFGVGNLAFKEIRRAGILDEMKDFKAELEADYLSLD